MTLMERISEDMKTAMKAKDKFRTQVLRMVLSEFKYAMTANERSTSLDDATATKVMTSYRKKLKKSLDAFPESEAERRSEISKEMEVIDSYLPPT